MHASFSMQRQIVLSSELHDAHNMSSVFLRKHSTSSCPILSQRVFSLLAVSCLLLFCETANSYPYRFDFPLGTIFKGSQTVLSQNGTFEAGLFSPPGSDLVYLGIWYAGIRPRTAVWVANRNQPVSGTASYGCSTYGELQLLDSSGSVMWSSGTKGRNVSGGVFHATGNIMLLGESASNVVWQSFDYPGNTWLPMMKLRPGRRLISWKSESDPSEGPYSVTLLRGVELVAMWENEKQYFTSGVWNGHMFSNVPEMVNNSDVVFFFDNSGFWWTILPEFPFFVRVVMDTNGLISDYSWDSVLSAWNPFWFRPKDQCVVYGLCGRNGVCGDNVCPFCSCPAGFEPADAKEWASNVWYSGCSLKATLDCREGVSDDGFVPLQNTSFDAEWRQRMAELGPNECAEACLKNCSCAAYSYDRSRENCELLGGGLLNGRTSPEIEGTVHMRVTAAAAAEDVEAGRGGRSGNGRREIKMWTAGFGAVAASLLVVGAAASAAFALKRRQWEKAAELRGVSAAIEWFTYAKLQAGTRNFSERLGSGGFGVVFKGSLPGGGANSAIAVKQLLAELHRQGEKQFRMEVATIGNIQHVNLVRLRGFCSEKSHRLLVYDYMPNGSLDAYLSSVKTPPPTPNARPLLDWATRYRIALDTARGIAYLHDGCRQCIIHCDIKPENILLDVDFSAKVADFGLAKLVGREFSRVLTTVRGTRGYLAPEWIAGMPITTKADVYSFGMTVLELVSGRRNADHSSEPSPADQSSSGSSATIDSAPTPKVADPHQRFFPVWAARCIQEDRDLITSLVDQRLCGIVDHEQLRRVVFTAVWCIQDLEVSRPTMRHVVHILEGSADVSLPPMPESLRVLVLEEDPWPTTNASLPFLTPPWLNQP